VTLRMRTMLLLCLLSVPFGVGSLSLAIVHSIISKQIRSEINIDLQRSTDTFRNIEAQQQQTLQHEASLLAALPVLKSLMTTSDARTIRDGGGGYSALSGGDLFALAGPDGQAIAVYENGKDTGGEPKAPIDSEVFSREEPEYLVYRGALYFVAPHALYFGPDRSSTMLGYVLLGYAVNNREAQEVSQDATAEVAFCANGTIDATTLGQAEERSLIPQLNALLKASGAGQDIWLGSEHFVGASTRLNSTLGPGVHLVVLKSWDQASTYLVHLNRLLLAWGVFLLVVSALLAVFLAATITRPLDRLVAGTRALGSGNFDYQLPRTGIREVRELGDAFDLMRRRLLDLREELLAAERHATIGRMASSISHDLRHYLSAVYANAEFLGYDSVDPKERLVLLAEIREGVRGMTDLIESLLLFSRTGKSLHPDWTSLSSLVDRSLALVRAVPDARNVEFRVEPIPPVDLWVDTLKIERALRNLILNACQAAREGSSAPQVHVSFSVEGESLSVRIVDNGGGVPERIRGSLFEPFVSEGKSSGMGLGLALAQKIAQEHNGNVKLEDSRPGRTVFVLSLAMRRHRDTDPTQAASKAPIAID
jgi:signal transduction histidine kinase